MSDHWFYCVQCLGMQSSFDPYLLTKSLNSYVVLGVPRTILCLKTRSWCFKNKGMQTSSRTIEYKNCSRVHYGDQVPGVKLLVIMSLFLSEASCIRTQVYDEDGAVSTDWRSSDYLDSRVKKNTSTPPFYLLLLHRFGRQSYTLSSWSVLY